MWRFRSASASRISRRVCSRSIAEPGSVLIAESTHRLVGSLFRYRELGPIPVKGFAGPVLVWQVVGASAYTSRFEALHTGPLAPLVGREEEIDLLLRRWGQAREGAGRVVLVSGEPGIGKSGEAKDGQILLSQRVNVALKGSVATEQFGSLVLKGLTQPVVAYNVPPKASQPALRVVDGGSH
jgi:class 3 adenylate cyclase